MNATPGGFVFLPRRSPHETIGSLVQTVVCAPQGRNADQFAVLCHRRPVGLIRVHKAANFRCHQGCGAVFFLFLFFFFFFPAPIFLNPRKCPDSFRCGHTSPFGHSTCKATYSYLSRNISLEGTLQMPRMCCRTFLSVDGLRMGCLTPGEY